MLDRNDKKYILRRIITYIAIAFIMFLISSCQVHAATGGPSGYNDIWVGNSRYNKSGSLNQYNGTTYYTITTGRDNVDMIQIAIDNLSGSQVPTDLTFNVIMYGTIWNPQVNINEYQSKQFGQSCTIVSENHYYPATDYTQYELNVKCEGIALYKNYLVSLSGGNFIYGGISPTITYVPSNNNEQINQNIENLNNNITSEEGPTNSYDFVGYLPQGPLDSILNLPLQLLNVVGNKLGASCSPLTLTIPFINESITLPCLWVYLSEQIPRLSSILTWVSVVADIYILYHYLMYTYKWVDDTLTLRENNQFGGYE